MRITNQLMADLTIQRMEDGRARLAELQAQVASGRRIQNPSDDPALAVASLSLRSVLQSSQAYLDTSQQTANWLEANELALGQMVAIGARALDLGRSGLPSTQGAEQRQALAQEVDGLLQQAADTSNSTHQGRFIFAGFSVNTKPFAYNTVTRVVDSLVADTAGPIEHSLQPGQSIQVNVDSRTVYQPLFAAMVSLRDALQAQDLPGIQTSLASLETAVQQVVFTRSTNGARGRQVSQMMERMTQTQASIESLLSEKEDASLAESITRLKHQEMVYQAVLNVASRAMPASLFDYLG